MIEWEDIQQEIDQLRSYRNGITWTRDMDKLLVLCKTDTGKGVVSNVEIIKLLKEKFGIEMSDSPIRKRWAHMEEQYKQELLRDG